MITLLPTARTDGPDLETEYPARVCEFLSLRRHHLRLHGRHRFNAQWAANAGFRLYIGEWLAPVERDDWIYTASAGVSYQHDAHWSADLGYS
ncbi:MAG: hypothetical protein HS113_19870 [Verrucomicrobiales bacterium]|nr:hypothetical protein [Verrucomicrobiales bacterium]